MKTIFTYLNIGYRFYLCNTTKRLLVTKVSDSQAYNPESKN